MWQNNQRKQRFINAALSGDRSVRRIEDAGSQVSQFAMAKAIASGDPRLMHKAGLEAEIARLQRQEAAHYDDQAAVRRNLTGARDALASSERRILQIERDMTRRTPTKGDLFTMRIKGKSYTERTKAGGALLNLLRNLDVEQKEGAWTVASLGGFDISAEAIKTWRSKDVQVLLELVREGQGSEIKFDADLTALGLVSRLEHALEHFEAELTEHRRSIVHNTARLADYGARTETTFMHAADLASKLQELIDLEASLEATTAETEAALDDMDGITPRLRGAVCIGGGGDGRNAGSGIRTNKQLSGGRDDWLAGRSFPQRFAPVPATAPRPRSHAPRKRGLRASQGRAPARTGAGTPGPQPGMGVAEE